MSRHGIDLEKGESAEVHVGIRRILVGCGWEPHPEKSQHAFDLDVACTLLNREGKMTSRQDFVYYGNKQYGKEAVVHTGDNLTGEGEGDDERLLIDLTQLPPTVVQMDIYVAIYQAKARGQTFGMISDCYIRVVDVTKEENTNKWGPFYNSTTYPGQEFCRFNINDEASTCDSVLFGTLHRTPRGWQFQAVQKEIFGGFDSVLSLVAPSGGALSLSTRGGELVALAQTLALPAKIAQACSDYRLGILLCGMAYLVLNVGLVPLCLLGGAFAVFTRFGNQ